MAITQPRARRVKPLDAGPFAPEIGSFRLHLAAEGKAPKTVRTYVEAVAWFAAAHLIERARCTRWDEVSCHDAAILAQLPRADLLPEAWIAPQPVRQLLALLRHRASLVRLGTQLRNRIHAVAADHGYDRAASYRAGPGRGWLAELDLPPVSREIITGCLAFTGALAPQTGRIDGELRRHAKADPRVGALTVLPGVGQFTALVIVAEVGDITRFASARKLASWAGLTPTVRGSDLSVRHGHISKQGSAWLRWGPARPRRPPNGPRSSPPPTPP